MTAVDPISIQLYSLRSLGDVDLVLDTVAAAGYRHVELVGAHLDDAAATRAKLAARGLQPSSSHVAMAALRERPDGILDACAALGCDLLFMPSVPHEERGSPAPYWRALGHELGRLAERFAARGVRLGYHNHAFEMQRQDDGRTALEIIFEAAGASPLLWEADIAWLVRGGAAPKPWIERYRARLVAVHVKDIAPPGQNLDQDGWADVGTGVLDWVDLWQACRAAGARWAVVEHDRPRDPALTARICHDNLRRIVG